MPAGSGLTLDYSPVPRGIDRLNVRSRASATEWITFAPEAVARNDSHESFLADSLFYRLMGVGTTQFSQPMPVEPTEPYQPEQVQRGWDGTSKFFYDPNGAAAYQNNPPLIPRDWKISEMAARAGWWQVAPHAAKTKVGEYQDLSSSPFWDFDHLRSDGTHTLDLFGTGLDNETMHAGLYWFTPHYSADVRYERFLHRLDHDPLTNLPDPGSGEEIVGEDFNVGEDYAVRIQNIQTRLRGNLTKDVKYLLKFWVRGKYGERQTLGTHHGAPGDVDCRVCHVASQRQTIDWTTIRFEPVLESQIGPVKRSIHARCACSVKMMAWSFVPMAVFTGTTTAVIFPTPSCRTPFPKPIDSDSVPTCRPAPASTARCTAATLATKCAIRNEISTDSTSG